MSISILSITFDNGTFVLEQALIDGLPVGIEGIYGVDKSATPFKMDLGIQQYMLDVPVLGCFAGCVAQAIPALDALLGQTATCIYEFNGDKLKIALPLKLSDGGSTQLGPRPASFAEALANEVSIYEFTKQAK